LTLPPCLEEIQIKVRKGGDSRSYETLVYTAAITALHTHGFYDKADELYATAIMGGHLPTAIIETPPDQYNAAPPTLDLHGMSLSIAHAAVRVSLQHFIQADADYTTDQDVLIVTGRGNRSSRYLRPVLRPEVQRMLLEEFYPPLNTYSAKDNMGAIIVPAMDINSWNAHQKRQKSYHFLAIANILKDICLGTRLRNILLQRMKNPDNFDQDQCLIH